MTSAGANNLVRPFLVRVPQTELEDLRQRLRRTRWPERETVGDWSQGTPLGYVRDLCRYWLHEYDWPAAEARLNQFAQFVTEIDGLDIHFIHVRSPHAEAIPLVITHGWPGSVAEFAKVIGPLTDPLTYGGDAADAFHVVCPSLPGFGFSGKPAATGWGAQHIADAWDELMARLGYPDYAAQGGDIGSWIAKSLGQRHPDHLIGIHLSTIAFPRPPAGSDGTGDLTEREQDALAALDSHLAQGSGYAAIQSTRPQTVGYGLTDSPAALCAWIVEKYRAWSDCHGDPATVFSREEMLDNIMVYWLTATAASSARYYWESFAGRTFNQVLVPVGCSIFPAEIYRPSRRWAESQFPDLRYWNEPAVGGHFAALEQPAIYVDEVRAAARQFR